MLHGFDVFDTLITRCWWRPEDLFLHLGERLAADGLISLPPEEFARRRIAAEAALRARPGVEEVSLAQIHAALGDELGWGEAERRRAAELELALEEEAIRPIAVNAEHLARLQSDGAQVALLSDTYLDTDSLQRLLRRAGITVPSDRVFASSTLDATKRSGRLFRVVLERLGVAPDSMAHRGDHPHSDLASPRIAGVRAELCVAGTPTRYEKLLFAATHTYPPGLRSGIAGGARAARLSRSPDGRHARALWTVGANVAGPLLSGFVLWVLQEARKSGLKRLHFVSRDGQILLRIAEVLLSRLRWDIECRYLLGSRQAWHLPAMQAVDESALTWLAREAPTEPLRSILARAELAPQELRGALMRQGFLGPDVLDQPASTPQLIALLQDAEVEAALLAAAARRRRVALGYLRQEGVPGEAPAGMVDLGWHGRLQRSLYRLLALGAEGPPPPLTGFYLALRSRPDGFAPEQLRAYVEAPDVVARLNAVLFEIFCAADHGTVRRYVERPDGGFAAELAEGRNDRVLSWGLGGLQDGILAFATELAEALRRSDGADSAQWTAALRDGGLAAYEAFRREPSAEEADAFGVFPHSDGQAHEVWRECAPHIGTAMRLRLALGVHSPDYTGHWPEASLRRGGGTLAEAIFGLKRLRRRLSTY